MGGSDKIIYDLLVLQHPPALLTKPQHEEFKTKAAEALATQIESTETAIDDELVRQVDLALGGIISKRKVLVRALLKGEMAGAEDAEHVVAVAGVRGGAQV